MGNKKALFILLFFILSAVTAGAHPLGNFTVNNFSRIEIEQNKIRLHCVLDLAEIPAFQESQQIDTDKNGALSEAELNFYLDKITAPYTANLKLLVDGEPLQIKTEDQKISVPTGAGNLATLRAEWNFTADYAMKDGGAAQRLRFENDNYKERVGWNEIVVNRSSGVNVFDSSAFGSQLSDELKTYPEDMTTSPLSERVAELSFTPAEIPANAKTLQNRDGKISAPVQKDALSELIPKTGIVVTPNVVLLGLLIAFGLGTVHAMSPGHGKTVVGAYLVGSKGTIKHAVFLGLTVTITHTIGVFAFGLITLFAAQYILPERILPYLSFISGLIVLLMGLSLIKVRLFSLLGWQTPKADSGGAHAHADAPDAFTHTHDGNTHSHLPPKSVTWKSLLALGISGGLLPCPSAIVLMLAAIGAGQIAYGLALTLSFSIGLSATLMCVGLAFLYLGKLLDGPKIGANPIVKALPVFSALVIAVVGAVICYTSIR